MEKVYQKIENDGQYIAVRTKKDELQDIAGTATERVLNELTARVKNIDMLLEEYEKSNPGVDKKY